METIENQGRTPADRPTGAPEGPTPRRATRPQHAPGGALRIAVDPDEPEARPLHRSLRIAVDFDGVLFDHVPYLLRGFRDAHGIDLAAEGLRHWDFFQYRSVRERNLTWGCVKRVLRSIDADPAIHELPPRDPHAALVLRAWRAAGHEVSIVTAREEESRATTETFLRRNRIPHDRLVMQAAIKTGYDVLIDDAPHNVLMAAAAEGLALLMDHPYNRDVPTGRNPLRVRDWHDVAREVERHLARPHDSAAPSARAPTEAPA